MAKNPRNNFYAYRLASGQSGVVSSWLSCEKIVKGRTARYKGFASETSARQWLNLGAQYEAKPAKEKKVHAALQPGIYFDAGTGRGDGVEISVTDETGKNLLHKSLKKADLNKFGKHLVTKEDATNNFGELLACSHALKIAMKERILSVFGDSKLVIEYWSKGYIKKDHLPEETIELASEVRTLRAKFERMGGRVAHISGDINPADLGFH